MPPQLSHGAIPIAFKFYWRLSIVYICCPCEVTFLMITPRKGHACTRVIHTCTFLRCGHLQTPENRQAAECVHSTDLCKTTRREAPSLSDTAYQPPGQSILKGRHVCAQTAISNTLKTMDRIIYTDNIGSLHLTEGICTIQNRVREYGLQPFPTAHLGGLLPILNPVSLFFERLFCMRCLPCHHTIINLICRTWKSTRQISTPTSSTMRKIQSVQEQIQ